MKRLTDWFLNPPLTAPSSVVLLRVMTGLVFFWEGVLKFVYVNQGLGRFTKLGIPFPEFSANFIGGLEIVGGLCIMLGLFTRVFGTLFVIEMIVAMLSTKIGIYFGTSPLPLPPSPPQVGFWAVLHEIRSEYAQLMTSLFYCVAGPGAFSLDAWLKGRRENAGEARKHSTGVLARDAG
jgi:putative oxidoreductase